MSFLNFFNLFNIESYGVFGLSVGALFICISTCFEGELIIIGINDGFNSYFIEEFDIFCEVLCDELAILSCYMKNSAFKEEDEVRIFYAPIIYDNDPVLIQEQFGKTSIFINYVLKPINFLERKDQIIGYCDLSFEKLI